MTRVVVDRVARTAFARSWAAAVAGTSYVPLSTGELEQALLDLTNRLISALTATPFSPSSARSIGKELVDRHFTSSETLGATVAHMGTLSAFGGPVDGEFAQRIGALQGALADGFASALRRRTLDEQEGIRRAAAAATVEVERALRASEARFEAVVAGAPIGVGIGRMDGQILYVNASLQAMLGYDTHEFIQRSVGDFIHPDDAPGVWQLYDELVTGARETFQTEKRFFRSDGAVIWTNLSVALVRDEADRPQFQIAMMEDITQRRHLQNRLAHEASHDALTGIANRAAANDYLAELFAAHDDSALVGACFIDLDGFKGVNDRFGHATGDALLAAVAGRFAAALDGRQVMLARLGGDEFLAIVPYLDHADQAVDIAEQLLASLDAPFDVGEHTLEISASIGVAAFQPATRVPSELLRAADAALQASKEDGKARCSVFDPARDARQRRNIQIAAAMPAALATGEFVVEYQPIVRLADGAVAGTEALVRWRHPTYGLLRPAEFISIAERTGVILDLGRWVLGHSCRQLRAWSEAGVTVPMMSVNVCVRQLTAPDFVDDVVAILDATGVAARRLQLELTESTVIESPGAARDALERLAELDVRLAIDDVGTGYSNLAHLRDLPLHGMKLAGSFAGGMEREGSVDARIVAALLSVAQPLGLMVTAEGVETATQALHLRRAGCDLAQGAYFGSAMPAQSVANSAAASHVAAP